MYFKKFLFLVYLQKGQIVQPKFMRASAHEVFSHCSCITKNARIYDENRTVYDIRHIIQAAFVLLQTHSCTDTHGYGINYHYKQTSYLQTHSTNVFASVRTHTISLFNQLQWKEVLRSSVCFVSLRNALQLQS